MPQWVKDKYGQGALDMWDKIFDSAKGKYGESSAAAIATSAVEKKYGSKIFVRRNMSQYRRSYAYRGYEEDTKIISGYIQGIGNEIAELIKYLEDWEAGTLGTAQFEIDQLPQGTPERKRALRLIQNTLDNIETLITQLATKQKIAEKY